MHRAVDYGGLTEATFSSAMFLQMLGNFSEEAGNDIGLIQQQLNGKLNLKGYLIRLISLLQGAAQW